MYNNKVEKIESIKDFQEKVLGSSSQVDQHITNSYTVSVKNLFKYAESDPSDIHNSNNQFSNTQFKDSHPSVVIPKHQYAKYRMKDGRNKTGLGIINEKPLKMAQFAIMNQMRQDLATKQDRWGTKHLNLIENTNIKPAQQLQLNGNYESTKREQQLLSA